MEQQIFSNDFFLPEMPGIDGDRFELCPCTMVHGHLLDVEAGVEFLVFRSGTVEGKHAALVLALPLAEGLSLPDPKLMIIDLDIARDKGSVFQDLTFTSQSLADWASENDEWDFVAPCDCADCL